MSSDAKREEVNRSVLGVMLATIVFPIELAIHTRTVQTALDPDLQDLAATVAAVALTVNGLLFCVWCAVAARARKLDPKASVAANLVVPTIALLLLTSPYVVSELASTSLRYEMARAAYVVEAIRQDQLEINNVSSSMLEESKPASRAYTVMFPITFMLSAPVRQAIDEALPRLAENQALLASYSDQSELYRKYLSGLNSIRRSYELYDQKQRTYAKRAAPDIRKRKSEEAWSIAYRGGLRNRNFANERDPLVRRADQLRRSGVGPDEGIKTLMKFELSLLRKSWSSSPWGELERGLSFSQFAKTQHAISLMKSALDADFDSRFVSSKQLGAEEFDAVVIDRARKSAPSLLTCFDSVNKFALTGPCYEDGKTAVKSVAVPIFNLVMSLLIIAWAVIEFVSDTAVIMSRGAFRAGLAFRIILGVVLIGCAPYVASEYVDQSASQKQVLAQLQSESEIVGRIVRWVCLVEPPLQRLGDPLAEAIGM